MKSLSLLGPPPSRAGRHLHRHPHTHTREHTPVHIPPCTHNTREHTPVHISPCAHTHVSTHLYTLTCAHTRVHTPVHTHAHALTCAHTCTHSSVHTHLSPTRLLGLPSALQTLSSHLPCRPKRHLPGNHVAAPWAAPDAAL